MAQEGAGEGEERLGAALDSGLVRFHPSPTLSVRGPRLPRPARARKPTYSSRKSRKSFWHFSATSSRTSGCWLPAPGSAAAARSMAALRVRTAEERPPQKTGRSFHALLLPLGRFARASARPRPLTPANHGARDGVLRAKPVQSKAVPSRVPPTTREFRAKCRVGEAFCTCAL